MSIFLDLANRFSHLVTDRFPQSDPRVNEQDALRGQGVTGEQQARAMDRARAWAYVRTRPDPDAGHDYDYFGD